MSVFIHENTEGSLIKQKRAQIQTVFTLFLILKTTLILQSETYLQALF
jgi:hypothetical protein